MCSDPNTLFTLARSVRLFTPFASRTALRPAVDSSTAVRSKVEIILTFDGQLIRLANQIGSLWGWPSCCRQTTRDGVFDQFRTKVTRLLRRGGSLTKRLRFRLRINSVLDPY